MHSVYDLGMLRSLRCRILRSLGYLVFSDFEEFWGQQTAGCYRLVCCYKLCTVPMAKFRCTLARSNVLYHRVPMQQLCPCTVPMYHVPYPCTVPMYQKCCTNPSGWSLWNSAKIGRYIGRSCQDQSLYRSLVPRLVAISVVISRTGHSISCWLQDPVKVWNSLAAQAS